MSARLDKLQELLSRVQRNAADRPAFGAAGSGSAPADDLMELDAPGTVDAPAAQASGNVEELDEITDVDAELVEEVEEEPPESGSGPRPGASPMEQALSEAGEQPPMTPPPESGEEPAPRVPGPAREGPTMEQLGETISLEEGPAQQLEVDEPSLDEPQRVASSQMEAELPKGGGAYDEKLQPPPDAQKELERVRLGETADLKVPTTERPVLSTNVVDVVQAHYSVEPETFVQLLDQSLSL